VLETSERRSLTEKGMLGRLSKNWALTIEQFWNRASDLFCCMASSSDQHKRQRSRHSDFGTE
jgi:hypothetical protein